MSLNGCYACPRGCGVDRDNGELGVCGQSSQMRISRISLHEFEEPPISGKNGSGTIFFCGCSLGCVFCQNKQISRGRTVGRLYTERELADEMLALQKMGATNINLVTPTHFSKGIIDTLQMVKGELDIPVVYNTSGYESVETLKGFEGLVDIYMPDFKYMSRELADKYSSAPDYPDVAQDAIRQMYSQVGKCVYGEDGLLKKGLIIRHLALPASRRDSIEVLKKIAEIVPVDEVLLSLMSQYTPDFAMDCEFNELHRRLTSFEYSSVVDVARELGFDGFIQAHSSATKKYTPNFS